MTVIIQEKKWTRSVTNPRGKKKYINLCWATGQLLANGILQGLVTNPTEWGFRIPWALQWIWPPFLIIGCVLAPESPWWLVKNNNIQEAEKSLRRLADRTDEEHKARIAQLVYTIQLEDELEAGSRYIDCFRGTDLRRTEVCCLTFMSQMLSGAQFAYGPAYFFTQAGMSTETAYKVGVGSTGMSFVGTVFSWVLITYLGRRTIFFTGMAGMTAVLLTIGIVSVSTNSDAGLWAQASLCLVWQLIYSCTVGPVCYAIISETSAIRLRAKSVVLARNAYNLTALWCGTLEQYMMNPLEFDWKGKTAFFWAGTCGIMTLWVFFRLPETRVSYNMHEVPDKRLAILTRLLGSNVRGARSTVR
jgi:MFS transporter, SP family, general alpha glucoside:H+ symporter